MWRYSGNRSRTRSCPGLPAGHPVHTYMLENRRAEAIIGQIQAVHDIRKEKEQLGGFLETLSAINLHYTRKENQLFPILEVHGVSGPSKVMWALHDDIRQMLKEVTARVREGLSTPKEIQALIHMVNDMIYKEEHILFPMALETLGDSDWAKVREGEEEIGYAWIQPAEGWKPSGETYQEKIPPDKVGSLTLDTGLLTAEQINLMLIAPACRHIIRGRKRQGRILLSDRRQDLSAESRHHRQECPELPSFQERACC